jgi:HlyD family secretion protein
MNDKTKPETIARLEAREQITRPLFLIRPPYWLLFAAFFALIFLLLLWAFLGRIPIEAQGRGVALSPFGNFLIRAKQSGIVKEVFVREGEIVSKGMPLMKINNPAVSSLLAQIVADHFKIDQLSVQLDLLNHAYRLNESLFEQGLIAKLVVDESKAKLLDKEIEFGDTSSNLSKLYSDLINESPASAEEVRQATKNMFAGEKTKDLAAIADNLSLVRASQDGKVLEIFVKNHDVLQKVEPLIWMEYPPTQKALEIFYSAVNADIVGKVKKGMRVLIEPYSVDPLEYGAIIGRVKEVFPFPVSKTELMQSIQNEQIVDYLISKDIPVVSFAIIEPITDKNNPSGFKWTSQAGPPFKIPSGSVAKVKIVIDEQRPISYLIPMWKIKKALGISD